jgi:dTDP-4-dehydrorhamnose 3,5-epimerase
MIFRETEIRGLYEILLERIGDVRGSFARTFCRTEFAAHGLPTEVVQANTSVNARAGTLRGMHYQRAPHGEGKLVRCLRGAIFDVVVDVRPDSPSYRRWLPFQMDEGGNSQIYIPPGCAHGFLTLRDGTEITYQMFAPFVPEAAAGFRYDDPAFGIVWPLAPAVIAEKDLAWPFFGGP